MLLPRTLLPGILLLSVQDPLEKARIRLPLPVSTACARILQYLQKEDLPRARKLLSLFDEFSGAYDLKWRTKSRALLKKELRRSTKRGTLLMGFTLLYADLYDRIHSLETGVGQGDREARRLLLGVRADFEALSPYLKAGKGGQKACAALEKKLLDLMVLVPVGKGTGKFGHRRDWRVLLKERCRGFGARFKTAFPVLHARLNPMPPREGTPPERGSKSSKKGKGGKGK